MSPATPRSLALEVEGLTVTYGREPALWNADLRLEAGALAAVVGPNGAGKSTLLKASLGVVPRVAGRVRVFGEDPARKRRLVAYVPQRASVDWDFPATVLDVVIMGTYGRLGWFRRPGRAERAAALSALEQMEIAELSARQISELSGGQQQRVFLARALAQQADLLLLDEPFAGVDAETEDALFSLLRELSDAGTTVVAVHHDLDTARTRFDDALLLAGEVVSSGPAATALSAEHLRRAYAAAPGAAPQPA